MSWFATNRIIFVLGIPYSVKVWQIDSFRVFGEKKFGGINRSANRLLIVSTNLDGFSLANHWRFAKFANFPRQTFPLYGMWQKYHMHGTFGGECNLADWQIWLWSPNLIYANTINAWEDQRSHWVITNITFSDSSRELLNMHMVQLLLILIYLIHQTITWLTWMFMTIFVEWTEWRIAR